MVTPDHRQLNERFDAAITALALTMGVVLVLLGLLQHDGIGWPQLGFGAVVVAYCTWRLLQRNRSRRS